MHWENWIASATIWIVADTIYIVTDAIYFFGVKSNFFRRSELTICFVVESIWIQVDSTTKYIVDLDFRKKVDYTDKFFSV